MNFGKEQRSYCKIHRSIEAPYVIYNPSDPRNCRLVCQTCLKQQIRNDEVVRQVKDITAELDSHIFSLKQLFAYSQVEEAEVKLADLLKRLRITIKNHTQSNTECDVWKAALIELESRRNQHNHAQSIQQILESRSRVESIIDDAKKKGTAKTPQCKAQMKSAMDQCVVVLERLMKLLDQPAERHGIAKRDEILIDSILSNQDIINLQQAEILKHQLQATMNSSYLIAKHNGELSEQIENLKGRLQACQQDLAAKIKSYQAEIWRLEGIRKDQAQQLQVNKEKMEQAAAKLQKKGSELSQLTEKHNRTTKQKQSLSCTVEQQRQQLNTAELASKTLTAETETLNKNLAQLRSINSALNSQLNSQKTKYQQLQKESQQRIATQTTNVKKKENEIFSLQQDLQTLNGRFDQLASQNKTLKAEFTQERETTMKLQMDCRNLQAKRQQKNTEIERLQNELAMLKHTSESLQNQIQSKSNETLGLIDELRKKEADSISQKESSTKLENEYKAKIRALQEKLQKTIEDHQTAINALNQDYEESLKASSGKSQSQLNTTVNIYESQAAELKKQIDFSRKELQEVKERVQSLTREKDSFRTKYESIQQDLYFFDSKVFIEASWKQRLLKLLADQDFYVASTQLIFRSSEHITNPLALHSIYDNLKNTLVVIRCAGNTFGGFINAGFSEIKDDKINAKNKKGFLFSLKDNGVCGVKPNKRLISYDEREGICFGESELRIIEERKVYSNSGVLTSSYNYTGIAQPRRYFGGQQEFPIEVYEVYELGLK